VLLSDYLQMEFQTADQTTADKHPGKINFKSHIKLRRTLRPEGESKMENENRPHAGCRQNQRPMGFLKQWF
jgi:hypothetical protein